MSKREPIDDKLRQRVLKRDGYRCRYCGSTKKPFHLDHVYPVSKGGETTYDNLVTSCQNCNLGKHDKVGIWPNPLEKRENINTPIAIFLFVLGLGILTTPFSPHFPKDMSILLIIPGVILSVMGVVYASRSL